MKLTWHRRRLLLRHPFNIARTSPTAGTDKQVLLVQIEHQGHVGWGEAAPVSYYRQSFDSAEAMFAEAARLLGHDPFALDAILDPLRKRFGDQPAAFALAINFVFLVLENPGGTPIFASNPIYVLFTAP